jgi:hypothetical protein
MKRMFLYGNLCGVIMAAALTNRGGGTGTSIKMAIGVGCGQLNSFLSVLTRRPLSCQSFGQNRALLASGPTPDKL